jgi:GT2 family glycosyltransferase
VTHAVSTQHPISVVVPSYDGRVGLDRCLRSLDAQSFRQFEVIVVDDGSRDGSVADVLARHPNAARVANGRNRGFAASVNAGVGASSAPVVLVVNDDVELDAHCVAALVEALDRHPGAAAVCPRLLRTGKGDLLDGAGDGMTRSLRAFRRGQGERAAGRYLDEEEVFSVSGTVALWRREAFERLGGFDESFFAYYEDVDLGFRARLQGAEFWYVPTAVAWHAGGATAAARRRELDFYWAVRNRLATAARCAPAGWLLRSAHLIVVAELASLGRAAAARELPRVVRAYGDVVRASPRLRRERRVILNGATRGWGELRPLSDRAFPPRRRGRP